VVAGLLLDDLSRFGHGSSTLPPITREALDVLLEETRKHGLSRTRGRPIPGIDALCAPVFDADGHIVLGILAMAPRPHSTVVGMVTWLKRSSVARPKSQGESVE